MRSRQRQQQFWGHGHRQWDSRWCQGSVREIGGGEFFVQFHFGWDHAIPHDRVFILLLPRCHTQLGGRSNSMWGENIIATFHSCILFGKYRFWSKILRLVSILLYTWMKMTSPGTQQKAIIGTFGAGILYKTRLLEDVSCSSYFFKPKVWRV